MCTDINRIAELAKEDPKRQFFSIAHLITVEKLCEAFRSLRKDASAGIDGVTYEQYETNAEENIRQLHQRLKKGKYQVQPLRRVYIPKEDGKQRPISIPALEDKIVQKVVVNLLNAIYEQDFLDCSYGFRPGRGQHQALDEVGRVICRHPTGWVLEIDIRAYFDSIVRSALVEMIEKRISDGSVLRLIQKWIKVGVIEEGRLLVSETGTGQGQPISPLLANVYLHHVLDLTHLRHRIRRQETILSGHVDVAHRAARPQLQHSIHVARQHGCLLSHRLTDRLHCQQQKERDADQEHDKREAQLVPQKIT